MSPRDKDTSVTALKLEKNRFYVLKMGKHYWVYASEDDVMNDLTEKIKLNENYSDEDVQLVKVQIFKRNWKLQEVPWFKALVHTVLSGRNGNTVDSD